MNRWLKWGSVVVLVLVLGLGALIATGLYMGEQRMARRIDIKVEPVALRWPRTARASSWPGPTSPAAIRAWPPSRRWTGGRSIRHGVGADHRGKLLRAVAGVTLRQKSHSDPVFSLLRACSTGRPAEGQGGGQRTRHYGA